MDPDRIPVVLTELQRVWLDHPERTLADLIEHVAGEHPSDERLLRNLKLVATGPFVTKTGRVLTDEDFARLADEAERGYDVDHLAR